MLGEDALAAYIVMRWDLIYYTKWADLTLKGKKTPFSSPRSCMRFQTCKEHIGSQSP